MSIGIREIGTDGRDSMSTTDKVIDEDRTIRLIYQNSPLSFRKTQQKVDSLGVDKALKWAKNKYGIRKIQGEYAVQEPSS